MNPLESLFDLSLSGDAFEWSKCRWLARLRWVMLGSLIILLIPLYVTGLFEVKAFILMLTCISFALILNLLWQLYLQKRQKYLSPTVVGFNLLGDLGVLSVIIWGTGGVDSPFFFSLLMFAALSGVLIRLRESWAYLLILLSVISLFYLGYLYFEKVGISSGLLIEWLFYLSFIVAFWFLFRSFGRVIENQIQVQMREIGSLQVQDKLRSLGALTAGFSHEFASPLFTVKSSIERGVRQLEKGNLSGAQASLEHGLLGVQDCESVIHQMNAAQLDPGAWTSERTDIVGLVKATVQSLDYQSAVEMQMPESLICEVPRLQFVQVLMNILDNASEVSSKIRLELGADNQWVFLNVEDQGPGFDESVLRALGEPFRTTKPHGSGLGLYLTRLFCENMGGHLGVTSTAQGSVVSLRWPFKETE